MLHEQESGLSPCVFPQRIRVAEKVCPFHTNVAYQDDILVASLSPATGLLAYGRAGLLSLFSLHAKGGGL